MATITLSSKHQVTLPVDMVRSLGLKAGDKLVAELIDGHIILLPKPESWTDYFAGSLKGVYGSTIEEINRYITEERASPERQEWFEQFDDLQAADSKIGTVVEALRSFDYCTASSNQLLKSQPVREKKLSANDIGEALEKLVNHGGVRKLPSVEQREKAYRLVHELVER